MLQNEHVTCNDTVVLVYPTSISNGDTILACTDANEKRLWQLQIPVMAHYSPNPLARVPLVIGAGVQANVLLSSIDQQKNYFNHKPLHWDISLSIGTCIKLPSNKYLRTEMQFRKPFPIQSFNPFVNTYAFQLGFEFWYFFIIIPKKKHETSVCNHSAAVVNAGSPQTQKSLVTVLFIELLRGFRWAFTRQYNM